MKKSLICFITALSVFNFSGCAMTAVKNIPDTEIKTQHIETDKLVAIGQIKSDGRFTVIGNQYLYVINDKGLNSFLSNQISSLNQYYLKNNQININLWATHLDADSVNKGHISFDLVEKQNNRSQPFYSEIEIYRKTGDIPAQYILNSDIAIHIDHNHVVESKGNKALSTILTPFAVATDIALIPAYTVGIIGIGVLMSPNPKGGSRTPFLTVGDTPTTSNPTPKPRQPAMPPRTTINRTPPASMPSSNPRVRAMQQHNFKR